MTRGNQRDTDRARALKRAEAGKTQKVRVRVCCCVMRRGRWRMVLAGVD